jgi:hypothetical protein
MGHFLRYDFGDGSGGTESLRHLALRERDLGSVEWNRADADHGAATGGTDAIAAAGSASPWKTTYSWYPNKLNGRSQQYHADLQRQLNESTMLSASFVGMHSDRLDMTIADNSAVMRSSGTPAQVTALRPYPYMAVMEYGTPWGMANYDSLQFKLDKRFSHGLQALVAYTFSKAVDNGPSSWFSGAEQDIYHPGTSYGPSSYNRPNILTFGGGYDLPFGNGKRWLNQNPAKLVLGNWQFNTITTLESGTPLNLTIRGAVANIGDTITTYERPNLVGDPYLAQQTQKAWFNIAAFAIPQFAYGNFGRDVLRGPAYYDCDLSLFKNIPIRESVGAQIRVEAFNAFNLMNYGNPGTTVGVSTLGVISSIQGAPRTLQFAMKVYFWLGEE